VLAQARAFAQCQPVRRALVVGINTYQRGVKRVSAIPAEKALVPRLPVTGAGTHPVFRNLEGAVNDAREFAALLRSSQFEPANIILLIEQEATAQNILDTFRRHLIDESTCPGDISVFFYSGHGSEIRNVARPEDSTDAYDQTLVPYDAADGVPDIRDKELVRLYAVAARKGVVLTVIADSCHSGGLSRGAAAFARTKDLPRDPRYVNDKGIAEDPTRQSPDYRLPMLLLAAAFEKEAAREDDSGDETHGALSAALFEQLRNHPQHDAIGAIFSDVQAAVTGRFVDQHPQIFGEGRSQRDLFGQPADSTTGLVARYLRLSPTGDLLLDRGTASGIHQGCEFKSATAAPDLRVRITDARLADSDAEVIAGSAGMLRPGDGFLLYRWIVPDQHSLTVYYARAGPAIEELANAAGALAQLESAGIRIIPDPTVESPEFQIWWIDGAWQLLAGGAGPAQELGAALDTEMVKRLLHPGDSLFVNFPLPSESAGKMVLGAGTPNDAVRVQTQPGSPEYLLAGRWTGKEFAYAWLRPGVTDEDQPKLNLPVRTGWVASGTAGFEQELSAKALQLNRIKGWLMLELPGGGNRGAFPYHLELRKVADSDSAPPHDSVMKQNERYKVWLTAKEAGLADAVKFGGVEQRWIYVLSLDSDGTIERIFPADEGNVGNHLPLEGARPTEISLTGEAFDFSVEPPYGLDTFILLSSVTPIDPRILPVEGVRDRSDRRGFADPLSALLGNIGANGQSRGAPSEVPVTWSVETQTYRTAAK
jgi:hypothetical protein